MSANPVKFSSRLNPRAWGWLFGVLLVAGTFLAYQPAWHGGFIWDDDSYVTGNKLLTAPDGLRRIWFSFDSPSQYFPLVYTTFRWERSWWGLDPTGYHFVNLALHSANALLLWRLLARLRIPGAALASAIFALHPVQVESVAWITERKNVLMSLFFLLTLIAWTRFIDPGQKRPRKFYLWALAFYVLALTSKTTACTLPAALVCLLWLQDQRITRSRVAQIVPFVFLGAMMGSLTVWWERYHQGTRGLGLSIEPIDRFLIASRNLWFYASKALWPDKLTFIYPRWEISAHDPFAYAWLLSALLLGVLIFARRKTLGQAPAIAAFFFAATLSPLLGFIMLYTFRYTFAADHYQYLAIIAPISLVSAALAKWSEKSSVHRIGNAFAAAAIVACLAVLTWRQSATYANRETLWRATIARNPGCWMAHNNLGLELAQTQRPDEAIAEYRTAISLSPNGPEADYNFANLLNETGAPAEGLIHAKRALAIKPNDAEAHISLGNSYFRLGRSAEALVEYQQALELWPDNADAEYNAAVLLLQTGESASAIAHFQHLLLQSEYPRARALLGTAFLANHQYREAIVELSRVLANDPQDLVAMSSLSWALATAPNPALRDGPRALSLAEKANAQSREIDPVVLRSLAAAEAETGDRARAASIASEALRRATAAGLSELCGALQQELSAYLADQPYREPESP